MLKTFVSGIKMYLDRVVTQLRDEVGWKSETSEELFSETVTTVAVAEGNVATLSYSGPITADTLKVTFNGVEYTCSKNEVGNGVGYGGVSELGPDFTEFPFAIISNRKGNSVFTETVGTYTVSASVDTVTTTDTFNNEVNSLIGNYIGGEVVVETTDPNEALFCTLKVNEFLTSSYKIVYINFDGTITSEDQTVLDESIPRVYVLAKRIGTTSSSSITFVDNNKNTFYPPADGFASYFVAHGIFYTLTGNNEIDFYVATDIRADLTGLEVHYFAVKSTSEDSGGDSPIIPDPVE